MRSSMVASVFAVALALAIAGPSRALTLPILGGPGLDQGEICPAGALCPGTPFLTLLGAAAATGTITLNPAGPATGATTADLTIALAAAADFGLAQILPGTTFTAVGIPVLAIPLGGGATLIVQNGAANATASLLLAPALPILASTPAVSGLTCTVGTGSDQCGFSFGPGGLTVSAGAAGDYDAFLTFNVNVPEPGTLALLGAGVAGLAHASRRRA